MSQIRTNEEIAAYIQRLNEGWKQILYAIPHMDTSFKKSPGNVTDYTSRHYSDNPRRK